MTVADKTHPHAHVHVHAYTHTHTHARASSEAHPFFSRIECHFLISQTHTRSKTADPMKEFLIFQENSNTLSQ